MTLIEFLPPRIAEDEANLPSGFDCWYEPERYVAECEAKRLRLKIADDLEGEADDDTYRWAHSIAEQIRKVEALPYADHPDYREEWKP